ncbi:MAG: SLC13/DASS family transporter [Bacteroidaceae bacterium]|nr:SLC13/DASS family transporter [Bacteroidaceae bacterium]
MFKNFTGSHLVEQIHAQKNLKRFRQSHYLRMMACTVMSVIIACLPSTVFGIDGLTTIEQRVIALFFFAASMWLSEALPSWGTSFLIIVILLLCVSDAPLSCFSIGTVTGEFGRPVPYKSIMATMADPTIMLFIGGFVLAIGLTKAKVDVYLARLLLKPFGRKSNCVLLGFIVVTAVFSAFVSNTATAAMMLAFLTPVLKSLDSDDRGRMALAMAVPIGANIGGLATPIGTPPNIIALGYLNETLGTSISFGGWMVRMIPLVALLLAVGWILLRVMFPFKNKELHLAIEGEPEKSVQTYVVIGAFTVTVFLWCFGDMLGLGLNSYSVALIPVAVFIVSGLFGRKDLEEINWGVLWMVAGGFALGLALNHTGLSRHLVEAIPFSEWQPVTVMVVSVLVCFAFSNFISNSATAALLVPVLGVIAGAMEGQGGDGSLASQMLVAVAVASSVSMMLPISTPPNAIAHSTGIIRQSDMIRVGAIIGMVGMAAGIGWMLIVF